MYIFHILRNTAVSTRGVRLFALLLSSQSGAVCQHIAGFASLEEVGSLLEAALGSPVLGLLQRG